MSDTQKHAQLLTILVIPETSTRLHAARLSGILTAPSLNSGGGMTSTSLQSGKIPDIFVAKAHRKFRDDEGRART